MPGDEPATVTFRHALVQEVAYDTLPFARRRDLHRRVADHIESTQVPLDHATLVHHYSRAGESEKTRLHAVRASEGSVAVYANREAVDFLDIALATVRGRTSTDACLRSRFEELKGDSLQTFGRHQEAITSFVSSRRRWASKAARRSTAAALEMASPVDDIDARDGLLCWKASVSMQRGPAAFRRAIRWLDMGMRSLPEGREKLAARILIAKSVCLCRLARYREALELVDDGLVRAAQSGDEGVLAYGHTVRSLALSQLGRAAEAIQASRTAIVAYERAGDLVGQALGHMNLGLAFELADGPQEALEQMEAALAIYARLGDKAGVEQMHHNLGAVLLTLGETDEGIRHLNETVSSRGSDSCPPLQVGWAFVLLAQAHLFRDEVDAAAARLREGREILERIDAQSFLLDTDIVEAQVSLARGELQNAERICARVATTARSSGAAPIEGEALRVLGLVRLAQDRAEAAVADLQASLALAEQIGSRYARAQALAALAEAHFACAAGDQACEDLLGEAIRLFKKMGTRRDLEKALEVRERMARGADALR